MCQSSLSTNFLLTFEELLDVKRPRTDGTLKRLAPSSVSSSFYLLLLLVIIMHYCLLLCCRLIIFLFFVFIFSVSFFLHLLLFSSLSSLSSLCVFCLCCLLSPDLYLFFCSLLSSSKPSLSLFPLHRHLLRLFLTSLLSYRRLLLLVSAVFFIFVCSFCLFTAVVF